MSIDYNARGHIYAPKSTMEDVLSFVRSHFMDVQPDNEANESPNGVLFTFTACGHMSAGRWDKLVDREGFERLLREKGWDGGVSGRLTSW